MLFTGNRQLDKAVSQSELVSKALEKTFEVILEALGATRDLDSNDAMAQCLNSISDCKSKMDDVSTSLADIKSRQPKALFTHKSYELLQEDDDDNPFSRVNDRNIRRAVEHSNAVYEKAKLLYELVLGSLGSIEDRDDTERLYQTLKTTEECRDKLSQVYNTLNSINQRLAQIELEVLYAPPPFFSEE